MCSFCADPVGGMHMGMARGALHDFPPRPSATPRHFLSDRLGDPVDSRARAPHAGRPRACAAAGPTPNPSVLALHRTGHSPYTLHPTHSQVHRYPASAVTRILGSRGTSSSPAPSYRTPRCIHNTDDPATPFTLVGRGAGLQRRKSRMRNPTISRPPKPPQIHT